MAFSAVGNIWNIVREIDLNNLKREAEERFTLLVAGSDKAVTQTVAERLSAEPGKEGVHPWIRLQVLPLPAEMRELSQVNAALLVIRNVEMNGGESQALERLYDAKVPVVVAVVNAAAVTQVGAELVRTYESARVILPSTLEIQSVQERLGSALLAAVPEKLRLALARHLPLLRPVLIRTLIEETSRANAVYSASTGLAQVVPVLNLPFAAADIVVLTKNQLVMAYKIALAAGKQGEPRDVMGEIVSVVGGGLLFRQVARELIGLIPVIGIVPKVAVAYGGTFVIGRSVQLWATEGQKLTASEVRRFYNDAVERGRGVAERIVERVRQDRAALPAPDGERRRWWHRFRRQPKTPLLVDSGESALGSESAVEVEGDGNYPLVVVEPKPTFWQRIRGRLPFGKRG